MANYLSIPFRTMVGNTYAFTHPGAAGTPQLHWWDGIGNYFGTGGPTDFSPVTGSPDSYSVAWGTNHKWTHKYWPSAGYGGGGCAHIIQRGWGNDPNIHQFNSGWLTNGSSFRTWDNNARLFVRFRIRYDLNWRWDGEDQLENKMGDWGEGDADASRIIIMGHATHTGGIGTLTRANYSSNPVDPNWYGNFGSLHISHGIGGEEPNPTVTEATEITFGQWYHVQFEVQAGTNGIGYLKHWVNRNDYNNPNGLWVATSTVPIQTVGWDDSWEFGGFQNDYVLRDQGFMFNDLIYSDTFDAEWAPSEITEPAPRRRIVSPYRGMRI